MILLAIAWKDIVHSVRSVFLVVFALVLPLLTTGVFFAAFGGISFQESSGFQAPRVMVVNEDGEGELAESFVERMTGEEMRDIMETVVEPDALAAREAVDRQDAAAAVILPQGFSESIEGTGGAVTVEIYQDSGLTVGPAVMRMVVRMLLDGYSGGRVVVSAVKQALEESGVMVDGAALAQIGQGYAGWAGGFTRTAGNESLWTVESIAERKVESAGQISQMISVIMTMMMVFYCFFTGTAAAQSILQEQEDGTLPRMFTAPVRRSVILAGKLLAVFLTLAVQVGVLLIVSALVFGIEWGEPVPVILAAVCTAALSASFAVCLTSFLKSIKQAALVYSVVVNLTGWIGISRLFAGIIPGMSKINAYTDWISLMMPQGWAARVWQESMAGDPLGFTLAGMVAFSALLFGIGVCRFNRRFEA